MGEQGPCLLWGRIPTTQLCLINVNEWYTCKKEFMLFQNNVASKGLIFTNCGLMMSYAVLECSQHWYQALPEPHDDVIKWRHFPRYWPFVRGNHRSPVNSPHKGQWRGALMLSFICVWINGWVNNGEAGDLRRHRPYYDVIVMNVNKSSVWYCGNLTVTTYVIIPINWIENYTSKSTATALRGEWVKVRNITSRTNPWHAT